MPSSWKIEEDNNKVVEEGEEAEERVEAKV